MKIGQILAEIRQRKPQDRNTILQPKLYLRRQPPRLLGPWSVASPEDQIIPCDREAVSCKGEVLGISAVPACQLVGLELVLHLETFGSALRKDLHLLCGVHCFSFMAIRIQPRP